MTTAMQSGEQQISATDRYFDGVVAYYSPVIFREDPPAGLRDGFQVDVGAGARTGWTASRRRPMSSTASRSCRGTATCGPRGRPTSSGSRSGRGS